MDSRAFREIVFLNLLRASIPPSRRNYPKNGKISYFVELTRFESLTRLPGCRRAFSGFRHKFASNLTKNASHETNHLASRDLPSLPIHCSLFTVLDANLMPVESQPARLGWERI